MPNDNNLENLTVDEINELYKDILELPDSAFIGVYQNCNTCNTTPSYHYSSPTSPQK